MDLQHERIQQVCRQQRIDVMGEQYSMLAAGRPPTS